MPFGFNVNAGNILYLENMKGKQMTLVNGSDPKLGIVASHIYIMTAIPDKI